MEILTKSASRPETKRDFVGSGWNNTWTNPETKEEVQYINGTFDRGVVIDGVDFSGVKFQLWANIKRDGKKDADLRLQILTEVKK